MPSELLSEIVVLETLLPKILMLLEVIYMNPHHLAAAAAVVLVFFSAKSSLLTHCKRSTLSCHISVSNVNIPLDATATWKKKKKVI